jgi:hypothetical protein
MKLNKDGTPRKKGSGRTKGSTSFVTYTLKQLMDQLPEGTKVVASRKWSEALQLEGGEPYSVTPIKAAVQPKAEPKPEPKAEKPTEETVAPIQVTTIDFNDL